MALGIEIIYVALANVPSSTANSIHVMKMCQAIRQEGHDVTLIVPEFTESSILSDIDVWEFYGIRDKFNLHKLPGYTKLRGNAFYWYLILELRKHRSAMIFTRDIKVALLAGWLGHPVIYEAHFPMLYGATPLYYGLLVRMRRLCALVVISDALKVLFQKSKATRLIEDRLLVAHDGADVDENTSLPAKANCRSKLKIPQNAFVVVYTGHLYLGRGIEQIIAVAEKLKNVFFHLVGGKEVNVAKYREKTAHLNNVNFHGFVPCAEVPEHLASADVLVMPYQRALEISSGTGSVNTADWMSPMKLFEYMAAQRPVISSDLPVLREVLSDEGNALLVQADDVKQWREAIVRLRDDRHLGERLASQAWHDVTTEYTWRQRARRIMKQFV
jgi:glycosyltransferase involved in cell wall biosynthesis